MWASSTVVVWALEVGGLERIFLSCQLRNQFVLFESLKFVRVCVLGL